MTLESPVPRGRLAAGVIIDDFVLGEHDEPHRLTEHSVQDLVAAPTIFGLIAMLVANVLVIKGSHTMFKTKQRLVKEA